MCLAKVFDGPDGKLILDNVSKIEQSETKLTLTDLFGASVTVEGRIVSADLTGGKVIIAAKQ